MGGHAVDRNDVFGRAAGRRLGPGARSRFVRGRDLEIVTGVLPAGRVGEPYTAELEVDGDGDEFRVVSGDLPPGMSFSDDGEFFGNPTVAGAFTFTIEVFDLFRGFIDARASKGFSISIAP